MKQPNPCVKEEWSSSQQLAMRIQEIDVEDCQAFSRAQVPLLNEPEAIEALWQRPISLQTLVQSLLRS